MSKTLGELMLIFGKFHCNATAGIDGSAIYKGNIYPIAIDEDRGTERNNEKGINDAYIGSCVKELEELREK